MNVYQIVTERILETMKKGVIPWRKPWMSMELQTGAFNRITKRPYSLLNQMLLQFEGEYATIRQWASLNGELKENARSEIVVFWKIAEKEVSDDNGITSIKKIPVLRYYRVYHISQVSGVQPLSSPKRPSSHIGIEAGDQLIRSYINREQISLCDDTYTDRAYYSPVRDYIQVPCRKQYACINEFYSTIYHEMAHSTGHKSRLDRNIGGIASSDMSKYSLEELVAEISSAMLLHITEIATPATLMNNAGYIQAWMRKLKQDDHLIVSAASRAEKAVRFITG